jgi:hypothetical protein
MSSLDPFITHGAIHLTDSAALADQSTRYAQLLTALRDGKPQLISPTPSVIRH